MSLRVVDEPAYVLHAHDWSESSLILEALTRHHGRVALVAKGVKKPHSNLRGVLMPFQQLRLHYGGRSEVRTLGRAQWAGAHAPLPSRQLFAGYYLNELLLRLMAREDAHPAVFDQYAHTLATLGACAEAAGGQAEAILRRFELVLLRDLGWLPELALETASRRPVQPDRRYRVLADAGVVAAPAAGPTEADGLTLDGTTLLALAEEAQAVGEAMPETGPEAETPASSILASRDAPLAQPAVKAVLRALIQHHLGGGGLRTRQFLVDWQRLQAPVDRLNPRFSTGA